MAGVVLSLLGSSFGLNNYNSKETIQNSNLFGRQRSK